MPSEEQVPAEIRQRAQELVDAYQAELRSLALQGLEAPAEVLERLRALYTLTGAGCEVSLADLGEDDEA